MYLWAVRDPVRTEIPQRSSLPAEPRCAIFSEPWEALACLCADDRMKVTGIVTGLASGTPPRANFTMAMLDQMNA
jgi:hypothetical protein